MTSAYEFDNIIALIEKLHEPWGIKYVDSRHVYLNKHARIYTNTPENFSFEGCFDSEFPAEWHCLHDDLVRHDQETMKKQCSTSVLEIHCWNGSTKPLPYISEKTPIINNNNVCIGVL